jgi:hypothetical protein
MKNGIDVKDLCKGLTAAAAFIDASRGYYRLNPYGNEKLMTTLATEFLTDRLNDTNISEYVEETANSIFQTLRTDSTIGTLRVINIVALQPKENKVIISQFFDKVLTPVLKDDAGIARGLKIITRELNV